MVERVTLKVYIASPYTIGDVAVNVRNAIDASDQLMRAGYLPHCPLLNHFWHMIHPHPWQEWIDNDLEWLATCDIFVRLPGPSKGADLEELKAKELGLKISTISELLG